MELFMCSICDSPVVGPYLIGEACSLDFIMPSLFDGLANITLFVCVHAHMLFRLGGSYYYFLSRR